MKIGTRVRVNGRQGTTATDVVDDYVAVSFDDGSCWTGGKTAEQHVDVLLVDEQRPFDFAAVAAKEQAAFQQWGLNRNHVAAEQAHKARGRMAKLETQNQRFESVMGQQRAEIAALKEELAEERMARRGRR